MMWTLVICTNGWILCGQLRHIDYPSKIDCYEAMDSLYKNSKPEDYKYVICSPKQIKKDGE